MKKYAHIIIVMLFLFVGTSLAQEEGVGFVFGDFLPDAPELAARGEYSVGVQTMTFVNPDQVDVLNDNALYDRELTVEIWYPASLAEGEEELVVYNEMLGVVDEPDAFIPYTFTGRAARDAEVNRDRAAYPLVIVSHGYPGSRLMLTYLNENLASKGYVVVAIDHMESTFADKAHEYSSLTHRAVDQEFVLSQMAELNEADGFFNGLIDADNTAVIGYSTGGYGTLNVIGAGYNPLLGMTIGPAIAPRLAGNFDGGNVNPRIKAAVLFAPFGGDLINQGYPGISMWQAAAMADITVPTFWVVGSEDDVAMYDAVVRLFDESINSERYLLTYQGARHNVAPNPPPPEALSLQNYQRYAEFVWDEPRINNINQHFLTAFLDYYLKGDETMYDYLHLDVEIATDGVYAVDDDGNPTEEHTYWLGFQKRTAMGMEFRTESAQ